MPFDGALGDGAENRLAVSFRKFLRQVDRDFQFHDLLLRSVALGFHRDLEPVGIQVPLLAEAERVKSRAGRNGSQKEIERRRSDAPASRRSRLVGDDAIAVEGASTFLPPGNRTSIIGASRKDVPTARAARPDAIESIARSGFARRMVRSHHVNPPSRRHDPYRGDDPNNDRLARRAAPRHHDRPVSSFFDRPARSASPALPLQKVPAGKRNRAGPPGGEW